MAKVGGVLAWHPEVAMSREEIDEFLSGRWVARLATIGRDGYPHAFPFWYYWDGENIYTDADPQTGLIPGPAGESAMLGAHRHG
jgi:hypothetical protein